MHEQLSDENLSSVLCTCSIELAVLGINEGTWPSSNEHQYETEELDDKAATMAALISTRGSPV